MVSRKPPVWQAILERIESQNLMTIEAVEENSAAIRELSARMEGLARLDERVAALERRTG
jgi:hypothetical protein